MGDRVIFVCKNKWGDYSPGVYLHASGRSALKILNQAARFMRAEDVAASAAGLCGYCFKQLGDDSANWGFICLFSPPLVSSNGVVDWEAYGHGNAGVVIIDVDTGYVECQGGYLHGNTIEKLDLPNH